MKQMKLRWNNVEKINENVSNMFVFVSSNMFAFVFAFYFSVNDTDETSTGTLIIIKQYSQALTSFVRKVNAILYLFIKMSNISTH